MGAVGGVSVCIDEAWEQNAAFGIDLGVNVHRMRGTDASTINDHGGWWQYSSPVKHLGVPNCNPLPGDGLITLLFFDWIADGLRDAMVGTETCSREQNGPRQKHCGCYSCKLHVWRYGLNIIRCFGTMD